MKKYTALKKDTAVVEIQPNSELLREMARLFNPQDTEINPFDDYKLAVYRLVIGRVV